MKKSSMFLKVIRHIILYVCSYKNKAVILFRVNWVAAFYYAVVAQLVERQS